MNITELQRKIDFKTKPLGALGQLEELALQIGTIQNTLSPILNKPTIIIFAADHGIAKEGVSAYPQEVTFQMVSNFLNGGAAINVFCEQHNINLIIADAGVNRDFNYNSNFINTKIAKGTQSFLNQKAIEDKEFKQCIHNAQPLVEDLHKNKCNVIGFGEMGIGNTSSASMIVNALTNIPLERCVGKGTGLNQIQLQKKLSILQEAKNFHGDIQDPVEVLKTYGGFEIVQMYAAMIKAYELNMLILVDGFIATSAFLAAYTQIPEIKNNAIFCHQSDESGHAEVLQYLGVKPLLNLNLRVGEGTGCAIAYPLIKSAINFLNNMASFDSAGVSNKD